MSARTEHLREVSGLSRALVTAVLQCEEDDPLADRTVLAVLADIRAGHMAVSTMRLLAATVVFATHQQQMSGLAAPSFASMRDEMIAEGRIDAALVQSVFDVVDSVRTSPRDPFSASRSAVATWGSYALVTAAHVVTRLLNLASGGTGPTSPGELLARWALTEEAVLRALGEEESR